MLVSYPYLSITSWLPLVLQNPFDSVSAEELEEYKRIINKREKGEESPPSPRDDTIADTMGDTTDPGSIS